MSFFSHHFSSTEIKECAITAVGKLFSYFGDELKNELLIVLRLLKKKLDNEITRTPTLKTLAVMATSCLKLDLSSVLNESTSELSLFLRQQSRHLKQSTLITLDALILSQSQPLTINYIQIILHEAANLVIDNDLHLTYLVLQLTLTILSKNQQSVVGIKNDIYPRVIEISTSPLLQVNFYLYIYLCVCIY